MIGFPVKSSIVEKFKNTVQSIIRSIFRQILTNWMKAYFIRYLVFFFRIKDVNRNQRLNEWGGDLRCESYG